ncbi:FAD-dependent oxidoreductase [Ruania rhizosphaerae]|uniref:FAD-dependent oxidoreductase n=1 Tax=Ruania rhizosphaerae TaxID=1840413 RepID=UPI001F18C8A8|nr:FAD-dependent oxidoreductase [Ruania rhizosphaerae]
MSVEPTQFQMPIDQIDVDVAVVGGGLAGVAAAIAASRAGADVALVQNRPVLGGNSSSEVRVWVCGATATGHQRFARETGIIGELYLENEYRNPEGNPYYWDLVVLEAVRAEPRIRLFLNTDVSTVETDGSAIVAVTGKTMGSERLVRISASMFIDCTGDGFIGASAGADYLLGREAHGQFQEDFAPDVADLQTLGSTLLFYTKDLGRPVPFVPPSFAVDVARTSIPESRIIRTGDNGADYWWIEWGGELDIVADNERIRDELWAVIYGIWDYIKNSGEFEAENLTLEWVGSVPGKREYRRLVGDLILTASDIVPEAEHPDAIGFGGWSVDLHPSKGVYHQGGAAQQFYPDGLYPIPFRVLYSRNVDNLLFAGRDISASHVAFGSTRVMSTCAVLGEAAGAAAALCTRTGMTPRDLATDHGGLLQQHLLREDAAIVGVRADDPDDVAPLARVSASSRRTTLSTGEPGGDTLPLTSDVGLLVPLEPSLGTVEVLLCAETDTELTWSVHSTGHPAVYLPRHQLRAGSIQVGAGAQVHAALPLGLTAADIGGEYRNVVLVLHENPTLAWHVADERTYGLLTMQRRHSHQEEIDAHVVDGGRANANALVSWDVKRLRRRTPVIRTTDPTDAFHESHVTDGYQRPYGAPRMWSSAPDSEQPQWVQLDWDEAQEIAEIVLIFNDDVDEYLNNLHYRRSPFRVMPELVRDYRVQVRTAQGWHEAAQVRENRRRRRVHSLEERGHPIDGVRVEIEATNGSPTAQIYAIRAQRTPSAGPPEGSRDA